MEYEILVDSGKPYFQINLSGRFDIDDLENCYQHFIAHPAWKKGKDILWDTRECFSDHLTQSDMQFIGKMTNKYQDKRGPGLAAWVVSREVDFGLGRMFEMINEGRVIFNFKVFRTFADAEKWILSKT